MQQDEYIYQYAMKELKDGVKKNALWIKAYVKSLGDEKKIKPFYLQYRVDEIKESLKAHGINHTEISTEDLYHCIKNEYDCKPTPLWMQKIWNWADNHDLEDRGYIESDSYWYGTIPRNQDKLLELTELELSMEEQIKELPKEIGNLKNLIKLEIYKTGITVLPKEIGNLENLRELDLSNNDITALPKEIGNLKYLTELNISRTNITLLPQDMSNLQQLTTVTISAIPGGIANLKHMSKLTIHNDNITRIPKDICNFNNLKELHISSKSISSLPKEIANLINLKSLYIINDSYEPVLNLPKEIGNLSCLEELFFATAIGDYVQATTVHIFPQEMSNLKNLKLLTISDQNINDIPNGMFDIPALEIYAMGDCNSTKIKSASS